MNVHTLCKCKGSGIPRKPQWILLGREEPEKYAFSPGGFFLLSGFRALMNQPLLPRDDVEQKIPIEPGAPFRTACEA